MVTKADDRLDFGKYSELRNHEMLFNVQSTQQPQLRASGSATDGNMMGGDGAASGTGADPAQHNKSSDNSYPAGINASGSQYQQ